jgi:hypothetical protein
LKGVVLDSKGAPARGAKVRRGEGDRAPRSSALTTDNNGAFAFLPSTVGKTILTVTSPKDAPKMIDVELTKDFKPLEIKLDPANKISGKITDENGKPLSDAFIGVSQWHGKSTVDWWTSTGPSGDFAWFAAPGDEVDMWIDHTGYVHQLQKMKPGQKYTVKMLKSP